MSIELVSSLGWTKTRKGEITKEFEFEGFKQAMDFVNKVADIANELNHHPDILVTYNKVKVTTITHDAGSLTGKDYDLAAIITRIYFKMK